jgi:ribosome maturation factor RimP
LRWPFLFRGSFLNREKLNTLIKHTNDSLDGSPYECIEIEWLADSRTLRVYLDRQNGGAYSTYDSLPKEGTLTIDDCVAANKILENACVFDSLIQCQFNLEVSSPGLERPLRTEAHFQSVIGANISARLGGSIRKNVRGRLVGISKDAEIIVNTDCGDVQFPLNKILKAHLVHEFIQDL